MSDDPNLAHSLFPPPEGRSVSSTLYDRSRTSASGSSPAPSVSGGSSSTVIKRSSSKSHAQRASHGGAPSQLSATRPGPPGAFQQHNSGSSPPGAGSARETFLNYFFGQNGPGPIAGSSVDRAQGHGAGGGHHHHHGSGGEMGGAHIVSVGRDVSGMEGGMASGLMAGKRGLDGNNAAYDMKSLGRHIEAVRVFLAPFASGAG